MLLETDIYNLAGRTLLMITRERKCFNFNKPPI